MGITLGILGAGLAQPPDHRIAQITGHAFRPAPLPESTSHPEARFRDTVSGRGAAGKRIPVWGRNLEHAFRLRADPETASRSGAEIWNALSAKGRKRKAHPILSIKSGRASLSPLTHLGKRNQSGVTPARRSIPTSLRKAALREEHIAFMLAPKELASVHELFQNVLAHQLAAPIKANIYSYIML